MRRIVDIIENIKKALNQKAYKLRKKIKKKYGIDIDIDDYNKLSEIVKVFDDVQLPIEHIKNNPAFKRLILSPAKDFYSKHNRISKTIILSEQLFDPDFRKRQPFHRIKHVPSLYELLVHEIGHTVDQMLRKKVCPLFQKQFGWISIENQKDKEQVEKQGYKSSLEAFLEVPEEKLTTIDSDEKKRIIHKIEHQGLYQKPEKHMKISWYGITGPREDFAESYVNYVLNSSNFKRIEPERYKFMKKYIFNNKEYPDFVLRKSIDRIKKAITKFPDKFSKKIDNIKTTLYLDSDLHEPYAPLPGSYEELSLRKEIKNKIKRIQERL